MADIPVILLQTMAGMEVGYVPIVLYEGVDKPDGCDEEPTPPPMPP